MFNALSMSTTKISYRQLSSEMNAQSAMGNINTNSTNESLEMDNEEPNATATTIVSPRCGMIYHSSRSGDYQHIQKPSRQGMDKSSAEIRSQEERFIEAQEGLENL